MTKHQRIHSLLDRIARLRVVLHRFAWSYVHDVDDGFFANLKDVLEGARSELGDERFNAVSVSATRRLADAQSRASFIGTLPKAPRSANPIDRVIVEIRALSEMVVSNQFITTLDEIIELYCGHLLRSAA